GYVSEAHLWAIGSLHVDQQPFVRNVTWPFAADAVTPLAYRPTADGQAIVPIYPPGLPMVMAVFERLANRDAVFYVVPLLAGLAAGAAILTRPNLVPLAVVPGMLLLSQAARARDRTGPAGQRLLLYAAGAIPACLIVAIVNAGLWGSPFGTGYEAADVQLRW